MRFSSTRALQYAVYEFHRRRNDLPAALAYFEDMFRRNFKRQSRLPGFADQLIQYASSFGSLHDNAVAGYRYRITISITPDLQVTGEVGRVDLIGDGRYAIWLLAAKSYDWQGELRMPLIQSHFAQLMGVRPEMVDVGFYFFDVGEHQSTCYNADELATAVREARALGATLAT